MGPLPRIRRFFRKLKFKQDPLYRSMMTGLAGSPIWTNEDLAKLAKEGYENCFAVFACIKQIVDAAGGIPWNLFKRPQGPNSKKEKIEDHGLLNLMKRPNPQNGGSAFTKTTLAYYLISGNSYVSAAGPDNGPPLELYNPRPDRMKILPGQPTDPILGYRYTVGADVRNYKAEEILHLKQFHPTDDWYGLSPLRVAAQHIDIHAMSTKWNANLLKNDCRPPGAVTVEGVLDQEQREFLEEQLDKRMSGFENAGRRPPIFSGGISWQTFAITPKDMDWIKSDQLNMRKICAILNVAPELIGDGENKTFSNYKEARKALYIENIIPLMDYLRDEWNNWLTPQWGEDRLFLEYDKNSIDAIREELKAIVEREAKAWWRTVNQHLIATGDPEIGPKGDVILIPTNLMLFSDISGNITEE